MSADDESALSAAAVRLLETARVPLAASGLLTAVALAVLAAGRYPDLLWWVIVLLAAPAVWIGTRVRFDAGLFRDLADNRDALAPAQRLAALDAARETLGLRHHRAGERPLADRVRGARTLVLWQLLIAALQLAFALLAAWPRR